MSEQVFRFDRFELFPDRRLLLQDGEQQRLGSRAFDLLLALIRQSGQVVSNGDLRAAVWPGTFVEEAGLRVHIAALRKTLGDEHAAPRFISNVPGRGYCFIAPLMPVSMSFTPTSQPAPLAVWLKQSLPRLAGRVIGRNDAVRVIAEAVTARALVSIVGPGGIGKTTVALQVATTVAGQFAQGVVFVDLTAVSKGELVPAALAAVLGIPVKQDDPAAELVAHLQDKQMLVLLDNCEHVVEAAAMLVETLSDAAKIHVLVTSREILRASDEWVHRLPPLGLPALGAGLTANEAMQSAAVELFVERVSAGVGGYALTDEDAEVVTEICRKLDGLALAIELAAGRVDTMGLRGLAVSLDDCLGILTQGRRTALPRHQTLRATLDWSYQLLPVVEQAVFRRLGLLHGAFTQEAAQAVATGRDVAADTVSECVRSLVGKSLVVANHQATSVNYRLLGTSRAFANELLDEAGERDRAAHQHAIYFQRLFERAEAEWETRPTSDWLADYASHMPNLRAALEWAFAPEGDPSVGIALAVAAVPLWFEQSLVEEGLLWVQRALYIVDANDTHRRHRMQLYAVLGWPSMRAISGLPVGSPAWTTALQLAEEFDDRDFQLRALWALWVERMNGGEPKAALDLADRFCRLEARVEAGDHAIGLRLRARSLHILGRPIEALAEVSAMLNRYVAPVSRSHTARFQYDQVVTARITRTRVLWVRGYPDQALRETEDNIAQALSLGHALTLTHALADGGCPVALMAGDLALAARFTALLEDHTRSNALDVWSSYADCFRGELLIRTGETGAGLALLQRASAALEHAGFVLYRTAFLAALARGYVGEQRLEEGLEAIDTALTHCGRTGEAWCTPELIRIRGTLRLLQGNAAAAEACFRQSLADAEQQGASSWALRTATDLARLLQAADRAPEAVAILTAAFGRFTEGFETPDLAAASALLAELPTF